MNYTQICKDMMNTAYGCGEIIKSARQSKISVTAKSSLRDLVTQYDVKVQEYAISKLSALYPDALFIGEEGDSAGKGMSDESTDDSIYFVIDPIDGTSNFIHNYRHSCTSIACVYQGRPVAAAVYNPYSDEMFHAVKDGGSFLNDEKLIIPEHSLIESLVLFGTCPYNADHADFTFTAIRSLYGRCLDLRRSGSAALDLSYVAAGRAGIFFEDILSTWDYAAGALLVTEAGGICTTLDGQPPVFDRAAKCSIIAGRKEIIEESGLMNLH